MQAEKGWHDVQFSLPQKSLCLLYGICSKGESGQPGPANVTCLPSKFPLAQFSKASGLQESFITLANKYASNHELLATNLKDVIEGDSFTRKMWELYERVYIQGKKAWNETLHMYLVRNDFLLHGDGIFQVELNTISVALAGLAPKVTAFHKNQLWHLGQESVKLPENNSLEAFGQAINEAHDLYVQTNEKHGFEYRVLFVILPQDHGVPDQVALADRVQPGVIILDIEMLVEDYRNGNFFFCEESEDGLSRPKWEPPVVPEKKCRIFYRKDLDSSAYEISVVYFRSFYQPSHFLSEAYWNLRECLECSVAVLCPSIPGQLVGTKTVQESWQNKGLIDELVGAAKSEEFCSVFMPQGLPHLGVKDPNSRHGKLLAEALESPNNFMLKPQREGGEGNIYDEEMMKILRRKNEKELAKFVLMQQMKPPASWNYCLSSSDKDPSKKLFISELGIYGAALCRGEKILQNSNAGQILRSKEPFVKEGNVSLGTAFLDSPSLI